MQRLYLYLGDINDKTKATKKSKVSQWFFWLQEAFFLPWLLACFCHKSEPVRYHRKRLFPANMKRKPFRRSNGIPWKMPRLRSTPSQRSLWMCGAIKPTPQFTLWGRYPCSWGRSSRVLASSTPSNPYPARKIYRLPRGSASLPIGMARIM